MAILGIQKPAPAAAILLAAVAAWVGYSGDGISSLGLSGVKQGKQTIQAVEDTIARFEAETDTARQQLAQGSMEDLRRRLESYRASLELMRRLVPERNELPNLMDAISSRARIRGVNVSEFSPLPDELGPPPFDTKQYQVAVLGHYDQIGEFLADIASLQRIIVPGGLTLKLAQNQQAQALGDSTGSMLEARFRIRTYVKSPNGEGESSGT
ncbi:MAG: type 4a pilus biogenesis protein PilO [Gemmatimonadales bacterium]